MKEFFKTRRMALCILLCVTLFVTTATAAIDPRTVSGIYRFSLNNVQYELTAHINESSDGGVYAGGSCYSSVALPKGYMSITAALYNTQDDVLERSVIVQNASYNKTVTCTTDRVYNNTDTKYGKAMAIIYNTENGDKEFYDSFETPYLFA